MSPEAKLEELYREWQRLALAEGEAIRAGQWELVHACQQTLKQLQSQIHSVAAGPAAHRGLRSTVRELFALTQRNAAALELRRADLAARRLAAARANHNLRRLQRSYSAPVPATALSEAG